MFHLAAFSGALVNSTLNQNVSAVPDSALTISASNRFIAPDRVTVFAATFLNDAATRSRLSAPSLRNIGLPEIYPITVSAAAVGDPKYAYWDTYGPTVQRNEELGMDGSCGVQTVLRGNGAIWFRNMVQPVPPGPRLTVVGTSTQTLVLGQWTVGSIALDQVLPVGRYAVIGMHVTCVAAVFARLVFPRGGMWRPGVLCTPTVGAFNQAGWFRSGEQGDWGQFDQIAQPNLELLGTTAGAQTATVIFDLVQVSQSVPG